MSYTKSESKDNWEEPDWAEITKRLLVYVRTYWRFLLWEIVHGGHQPEDLVQQAILKHFAEIRRKPDNISHFRFLQGIIRSDVSALLGNKENVSTERAGYYSGREKTNMKEVNLAQIADSTNEVERSSLAREYASERKKILARVRNDKLVYDMVMLIIDDEIYKPNVIASILDVDERNIYAAKKRAQRKLQDLVCRTKET